MNDKIRAGFVPNHLF
jgi:hypothetical protein